MWFLLIAASLASPVCTLQSEGARFTEVWSTATPAQRDAILGHMGLGPVQSSECAPLLALPADIVTLPPTPLQQRLLDGEQDAVIAEYRSRRHPDHAISLALRARTMPAKRTARLGRRAPEAARAAAAMLTAIGEVDAASALTGSTPPDALRPHQLAPYAAWFADRVQLPAPTLAARPEERLAALLATTPVTTELHRGWTRLRQDLPGWGPVSWYLRSGVLRGHSADPGTFAWIADELDGRADVLDLLTLLEADPAFHDLAARSSSPQELALLLAGRSNGSPGANLHAAEQALQRGAPNDALALLDETDGADDVAVRMLRARALLALGQTHPALAALTVTDRVTEDTQFLDLARSVLLHQLGRPEDARALLASVERRIDTPAMHQNLAWAKVLHGDAASALASAHHDGSWSSLHTVAVAAASTGDLDRAWTAMQQASAQRPLDHEWFAVAAAMAPHLATSPTPAIEQLPSEPGPFASIWLFTSRP